MTIVSINPDRFGGDNSPYIPAFIEKFCSALYLGKGGYPTLLKQMNIGPDFPMRCFAGLEANSLTHPQQLLMEAYLVHIMDMDITDIWVIDKPWIPTNPQRIPASLDCAVFDTEWACTLGFNQSQWSNHVLHSSSALQRQVTLPDRKGIYEQNVRLMLALAVYGFQDPLQFFTAK